MSVDLPDVDLSGRVALVTGANAGIGRAISRNLASLGGRVVMACRSRERGQATRNELAARTDGEMDLMIVDLADQSSIRTFCERFDEGYERLDILVNNAGIWPSRRRLSPDGLERTWATNVMGYFLLGEWLLPLLKRSAPARIVNVASRMAGRLDLDDLQFEQRRFVGRHVYMQSKQANRMLSRVRAEELRGSGVTVNAVHPGGVNTQITRHQTGLWGWLVRVAFYLVGKKPAAGADTPTWAAVSPSLADVTGEFFADRQPVEERFDDRDRARALRRRCEGLIRVDPPGFIASSSDG